MITALVGGIIIWFAVLIVCSYLVVHNGNRD